MILRNCEASALEDLENNITHLMNESINMHNEMWEKGEDNVECVEYLSDLACEVHSAFLRFKNAEADLERIMREEGWDAEERQKAKGK